MARKKKVISEEAVTETPPQEMSEPEPSTPEPEAQPNELEKVIAEAPELADVIKNPWLYSEWLHKLRRLQK